MSTNQKNYHKDSPPRILFLLSHQPNPRFVKQICYLSKYYKIGVAFFYREGLKALDSEYQQFVFTNRCLGQISHGSFFTRVMQYIKAWKKARAVLLECSYDIVIVNNIDTLALAKSAVMFKKKHKSRYIVEVADLIQSPYVGGLKGTFVKYLNKFLFKFVAGLIVTGENLYLSYYFKVFPKKPFVLNNKPLSALMPCRLERKPRDDNSRVVIGIVGLLSHGKMYQKLFAALLKLDPQDYMVKVYGNGTGQPIIEEYAQRYDNIEYLGKYNLFKDAQKIYNSIDILFAAFDIKNLNFKLALPNKLYEAMYYAVPILADSDSVVGEIVNKYGIGFAVNCNDESEIIKCLEKFFHNKSQFDSAFAALDKNLYTADQDYRNLQRYLSQFLDK